jgi:hypothetical protein
VVYTDTPLPIIEVDWDNDGVWGEANHDISADVFQLSYSRGASFDGATEAKGFCEIHVNNPTNKYDPDNAASPLFGNLRLGRAVWVRATYSAVTYALFYGYLRRIVLDPRAKTAQLLCEDPLYKFARAETSVPLSMMRSIREFREAILDDIGEPAGRRNLANASPEWDVPMTGADQVNALNRLTDLNVATGTVHYIRPHTSSATLYEYVTVDRVALATAGTDETYNDDVADMSGYDLTDEAIVNSQRVGMRMWMVPSVGSTAWELEDVPFTVDAGMTHTMWASFDNPVMDQAVAYTAAGSPTVVLTPFVTSAKIAITGGPTGSTISALSVVGRVAEQMAAHSHLRFDQTSIDTHGELRGSEISSDYFAQHATAEGLGSWVIYRYKDPKPRPDLTVENRFPSQVQRDITDRIALTFPRSSLSGKEYLIRSFRTDVMLNARSWRTTYQLESAPTTAVWFTIGGSADQGIGGSGVLAY